MRSDGDFFDPRSAEAGSPRSLVEPSRSPAVDIERFGPYQIGPTLAFGGMAQLMLALDERSGRQVVLKRILPQFVGEQDYLQFFIHEGLLGEQLKHPNIVETLESGHVGTVPYIALELLRGHSAIELLRTAARRRIELPLGAIVRIVADAARGLHHAHSAVDAAGRSLNVVHRDVTPHNLFVCRDGTTKVLDFGIAKATSQLHHTQVGTLKGKFSYLAPEQIRAGEIDHRVDVFALGIVLFELLTSRPLFRGINDAATLHNVLTREIPPPEELRPGVPPGLGAVAMRALQRDRDRRLPSALAIAESITAVAEAERIDTSREVIADLVAKLFPESEESSHELPQKWPSFVRGASAPVPDLGISTPAPGLEIGDFSRVDPPSRASRLAVLALACLVTAAVIFTFYWTRPRPAVSRPAPPIPTTPAAELPAAELPASMTMPPRAEAKPRPPSPETNVLFGPALHKAQPLVHHHAEEGRLRVAATPWAEVTIDGKLWGLTPLTPVELSEGIHVVTLKNADLGVIVHRRVTIHARKETLLQTDLFTQDHAPR